MAGHPTRRSTFLTFRLCQERLRDPVLDAAAGPQSYAGALDTQSAVMSKDGTDSGGRLRSSAKRPVMQHSMLVLAEQAILSLDATSDPILGPIRPSVRASFAPGMIDRRRRS
jgi:hypothetical protein